MTPKTTKNGDFNRKLKELESKQGKFNADRVISDNKTKEKKKKVLSDLFGRMKDAGVDFSNIDSINGFLNIISEQDPDFLVLLENAINVLSDDEGTIQDVLNDQVTLPGEQGVEEIIGGTPAPRPQQPQPIQAPPAPQPQQPIPSQPSQPIQLPQ